MEYLKGVSVVLFMVLVQSANAQVVITESMDIGNSSSSPDLVISSHNSGPGGIEDAGLIVEEGGELKIYIEYGAKYLSKISTDAVLQVQINGSVDTVLNVPISHFLKRPLKTPTNDICKGDWYLYGRGDHSFRTGYIANYIEDSFTSNRESSENFDYKNMSTGSYKTFNLRNFPNLFQEKGYIKFRIPTIPIDSVDLSRGLNRLSLELVDFELEDEDFFNVNLVNRFWEESTLTHNTKPTVKDTLAQKLFGRDRTIIVSHQLGYYFIDTEDFIRYWLSGNSNYGLRFSFPQSSRSEYIRFWSHEQGRFGSPIFEMNFTYPAGEPPLEAILPLIDVAKGDTVLVSFIDDGEKSERGRTFTKIEGALNGNRLSLYRMNFLETRESGNLCGRTGYATKSIEALTLIEHKEENLELLLDLPNPKEVWPTLIAGNAGVGNSDENNLIKNLKVTLTENSLPIENAEINLTSEIKLPSGGHEHNNEPEDYDQGRFVNPTTGTRSYKEMKLTTNDAGEIQFRYEASQLSGDFEICASYNQEKVCETILVTVPNLLDFSDSMIEGIRFTGNTGTTSYSKCAGTVIKHPNSHNLTQFASTNFELAIQEFITQISAPIEKGGANLDLILGLNDMSLPNEGVFDICSDWGGDRIERKGHFYHRAGVSVDIDTRAINRNTGELVSLLNDKHPNGKTFKEILDTIMEEYQGEPYPEASIHYGFNGN